MADTLNKPSNLAKRDSSSIIAVPDNYYKGRVYREYGRNVTLVSISRAALDDRSML